jgi:5-methylcytosine-specific restriction enzyme B
MPATTSLSWSAKEALDYLSAHSELTLVKPPSQYIAGFRTASGRELALVRSNIVPTLYLTPGSWEEGINGMATIVRRYSPSEPRNSNLKGNAPLLALGNPMVQVEVPTQLALRDLLSIYGKDQAAVAEPVVSTERKSNMMNNPSPLNQILYGPPGTGKTYGTVNAALQIVDPEFISLHPGNRPALVRRFRELCEAQRVRFVTFHQSFSYEDFVEGLKAHVDEVTRQISYEVVDGVFKSICRGAAATQIVDDLPAIDISNRTVWKMSLGSAFGADAAVYEECIESNVILLGWGGSIDFSGCHTQEDVVRAYKKNGEVLEDEAGDYKVKSVTWFVTEMKPGDLVIVSEGNLKFRAIGEVVGEYKFDSKSANEGYHQSRAVKWLRTYSPSLPAEEVLTKKFSQQTLYRLKGSSLDVGKLSSLLGAASAPNLNKRFKSGEKVGDYEVVDVFEQFLRIRKPNGNLLPIDLASIETLANAVLAKTLTIEDIKAGRVFDKLAASSLEPHLINGYNNIFARLVDRWLTAAPDGVTERLVESTARVLIIDEINRGNVSGIFGELITLIEPSKREGAPEALTATLPYSREPFSIPSNVYLVGTMNSADRSLTSVDIALRRRFVFREMVPQPELLDEVYVEGLSIGEVLRALNERIVALLDRDHCLGHAYFLPLSEEPTIGNLRAIFRTQVVPLLQEYFFDDWQRIQWVLNDHRKPLGHRFLLSEEPHVSDLFGADVELPKRSTRWLFQESAFDNIESYRQIIKVA